MAAVEAFGDGLSNFVWRSSSRMIILIGDKPPHPSPRGSITDEQVRQWADEKRVDLEMVQLPLGKPFPTPDDQ